MSVSGNQGEQINFFFASEMRREAEKNLNESLEIIYKCYPRKIAKKEAFKAIIKALTRLIQEAEIPQVKFNNESALRFLCAQTVAFANSPAGQRGCYTPYPATWFNRSSYLDDMEEWFRHEESKQDSLNRRNADAFAEVFGKLPAQDGAALLTSADKRRTRSVEAIPRNGLMAGD